MLDMEMGNAIRKLRQARGLQQQSLALSVGLSRQALASLETGQSVPSTKVALLLARQLGVRVEELFWLDDEPIVEVQNSESVDPSDTTPLEPRRLLVEIDGRWVSHPIHRNQPSNLSRSADGLSLDRNHVRSLVERDRLRETVLVVGCDPALGVLSDRIRQRFPALRMSWLHATSHRALSLVVARQAHMAGLHLREPQNGEFNVPFVRRASPSLPMLVVNMARWEEGLLVARGNPKHIMGVACLARPDVRLINRPAGAGARELLERELVAAELLPEQVAGFELEAASHEELARSVAWGRADVGIGTRTMALAFDLDFLPLVEERFDLVLPLRLAEEPRFERILDTLDSRVFRDELVSIGGYDTSETGHVMAEVRGGAQATEAITQ